MLRDEMNLYTRLTGEDGTRVPIIKLGAYLDGYEKGKADGRAEAIDECIEELKPRLHWKDTHGLYTMAVQHCIEVMELLKKEQEE